VWFFLLPLLLTLSSESQVLNDYDFGDDALIRADRPVVVFRNQNGTASPSITVTDTLQGFVFDDSLEYSRQLAAIGRGTKTWSSAVATDIGWFHPKKHGTSPTMPYGQVQDMGKWTFIGCGLYKFNVSWGTNRMCFYLDLTDSTWATGPDNNFGNILFQCLNGV
jgi:hypothetical protein